MEKDIKKDISDKYFKEKKELGKKYNVVENIELVFPMYNQLPHELQLAVVIIQKHNPNFLVTAKEVESSNGN